MTQLPERLTWMRIFTQKSQTVFLITAAHVSMMSMSWTLMVMVKRSTVIDGISYNLTMCSAAVGWCPITCGLPLIREGKPGYGFEVPELSGLCLCFVCTLRLWLMTLFCDWSIRAMRRLEVARAQKDVPEATKVVRQQELHKSLRVRFISLSEHNNTTLEKKTSPAAAGLEWGNREARNEQSANVYLCHFVPVWL